MKIKNILIPLVVIASLCFVYLVITRDYRTTKKADEKARTDSLNRNIADSIDVWQRRKIKEEQILKEQDFLNEISGVYEESIMGNKATLDLRGKEKVYNGFLSYKLKIKKINLEDESITFSATRSDSDDKTSVEMHITRMDSIKESPLTVDSDSFSAPWVLYWIRGLD